MPDSEGRAIHQRRVKAEKRSQDAALLPLRQAHEAKSRLPVGLLGAVVGRLGPFSADSILDAFALLTVMSRGNSIDILSYNERTLRRKRLATDTSAIERHVWYAGTGESQRNRCPSAQNVLTYI